MAFHHDPKIYNEPEAYKPERWMEGTPEYAADSHVPGKWMPFGEGTRVCVGQRLALMEARVALTHVFRRSASLLCTPGGCCGVPWVQHVCSALPFLLFYRAQTRKQTLKRHALCGCQSCRGGAVCQGPSARLQELKSIDARYGVLDTS